MRRLVAVLGAAMLVAVSCSSSATPGGGASPSAASTEAPQQGGRVIEATISDIATMQPVLVNDTASGRITALLYDNLIQVDYKTGEPQPRLATFSVSSDSLKYTYTIDPKAVWSDGKPIIAFIMEFDVLGLASLVDLRDTRHGIQLRCGRLRARHRAARRHDCEQD